MRDRHDCASHNVATRRVRRTVHKAPHNREIPGRTRFGVYSVVERCAAQVPALAGRKITPHALRHTTACHLVFAGVDINTVRAWLGHSSIDTTNIYAEINLKMKAAAMALCDVAEPDPGRHWKPPLEGGQELDGVPELLLSAPEYVAAIRTPSLLNGGAVCR